MATGSPGGDGVPRGRPRSAVAVSPPRCSSRHRRARMQERSRRRITQASLSGACRCSMSLRLMLSVESTCQGREKSQGHGHHGRRCKE